MLHVYYGTDSKRARLACRAALAKDIQGGRTELSMTPETYDELALLNALETADMFGVGYALVLDGLLSDPKTSDAVREKLQLLVESETPVYVIEGALDAATKKLLEKAGGEHYLHDAPKAASERPDFSLAHAFGSKKRAEAWVAYQRALLKGDAPEMIHGMLFWKAKQMAGGTRERSAPEARQLLSDLAVLPADARQEGVELEYALERFILER